MTGVDLSPEMLLEARRKYPHIKFHLGDMKGWEGNTKFAAILIFFNSILYNKNKDELKTTLENCFNQLQDNGVLIFDTVDKSIGINSKSENLKYSDKNLSISFSPQWIFNKKKNLMDLKIDFIVNGKNIHDHHEMGAFSFIEQKQLAQDIGFEVLMFERRFDKIKKVTNKSKKAIFVCQK